MPMNPGLAARAAQIVALERAELERLEKRIDGEFDKAIDLLRAALDRGHKLIVLGVGKSGHVGAKIAATLTSTGSRAVVLNSLDALHGDLGLVEDGDAVLALSYGGETEELLAVLPALSRFDVAIVSMTGQPDSTLARFSRVVLDVRVEREACPLGLAPTSSTTAMLALGDAIAMVLMEVRGFRREDFARFHPGGRLGRQLLLKTSDIMRAAERLPLCTEDATVCQALEIMTSRRCGAVVVVGADKRLAGIFTQGDFARRYITDGEVGRRRVAEVMTRNPVVMQDDQPAVEVLALLEERSIDDIIVVDTNNIPVGLIDSQDLSKHKLV